ncbi:MAG: hypothetical protein AAFN59_03640 [Pseudomonadota bacterium]
MRGVTLFLLAALSASGTFACSMRPSVGGVEIYPTARTLPANVLRVYVYFPAPMAADDILDHIALLDADGAVVTDVFLSNRYDLWSPDRRRLTLLFDPGRVKTGLLANDAMGRALVAGQSYVLRVAGTALDAEGCAIGGDATYAFRAVEADLDAPSPQDWTLLRPGAGTVAPLEIDLGSAHDHLSMAYRIRVLDGAGKVVRGRLELGQEEEVWRFAPTQPWADAPYRIAIDEQFEDLAGNRPGALFDQTIGDTRQSSETVLNWRPVP